ncbi:MAG: hypothetical protein PWQ18_1063, partial [Clostridia bacterium]|nr:hypothetical protein [Clostridia bacterium]
RKLVLLLARYSRWICFPIPTMWSAWSGWKRNPLIRCILLSATAGSGDRIIDRTAWRLVRTLYKSSP